MEDRGVVSGIQEWLATFAFSRSIRHAARDFSDAVLLAELLAQVLPPGAVALHNYPPTGRYQQKMINWDLLNRKVLTSMQCELSRVQLEDLASAVPGAITRLLIQVKKTIDQKNKCTSPVEHMKKPKQSQWTAPRSMSKAQSKENGRFSGIRSRPASADCKNGRPPFKPSGKAVSLRRYDAAQVLPRPQSPSAHARGPPNRSSFSLMHVLPSASERPSPEDLGSTFSRVLQMTSVDRVRADVEVGAFEDPKQSFGSSSTNITREQDGYDDCVLPHSSTPLADGFGDFNCVHREERLEYNGSIPFDIAPGDFVEMVFHKSEDQDNTVQLARVVELQTPGDCLIQLFKPVVRSPRGHATRFYESTPHFIECCSTQLQLCRDMEFDSDRGVWVRDDHRPYANVRRVWPVSPTHSKSRAPGRYSTSVLSKVQCTGVSLDTPVEVCLDLEPASARDESKDQTTLDLCPAPTVFAPVQLDLSELLSTPPPRFPSSPRSFAKQVQMAIL